MRYASSALSCMAVFLCLTAIAWATPELGTGTALRLYGATATLSGRVSFDDHPRWLVVNGEGAATWRVDVKESAKYRIRVVYSAGGGGVRYSLSVGAHSYKGVLRPHSGIFQDPLQDFGRMDAVTEIPLAAGQRAVGIHFYAGAAEARVRSIEIDSVGQAEKDEALARRSRANSDWLAGSGYGVMFHWTSQSQPRHGAAKTYAQAVADFDVPKFAAMVASTGAAYVIFTVNHADPSCPAPIASWEHYHPGWTTKRDLIGEIADALAKRHIRLVLYIASHTLGGLYKSSAARYLQIHEDVLTEIGRRYGRRIAGYWFDGWYQTMEAYPGISPEQLLPFVRAGNPDRLVAYNFWIYPVETPWQDYWAGEVAGIVKPAQSRVLTSGPGVGLQDHNLIMLDAPWVHSAADSPMEQPRFSDRDLIEYVRAMDAHHGAVTLNVGIFQDGTIGKATTAQLRALRKAIRGS